VKREKTIEGKKAKEKLERKINPWRSRGDAARKKQ